MKSSITTTIITLNEEENIKKCLESVKSFSDEIVVVDCGSKDRTVEIAKDFGAKVFIRKFDNYANQKNYTAEKATSDWIFSIDADEVVPKELAEEIKEAVKSKQYVGFSMPRKNYIFGKLIKHARWQPELDRHVWLWKKRGGRWVGDVHEEVAVKGEIGRLVNPKLHYQYKTVGEFMEMMNKYSEIESRQLIKQGSKFSFIKLLSSPFYNFVIRYFYRLGFLDGWRGFVLSYLIAIYHAQVWFKVWAFRSARRSHV